MCLIFPIFRKMDNCCNLTFQQHLPLEYICLVPCHKKCLTARMKSLFGILVYRKVRSTVNWIRWIENWRKKIRDAIGVFDKGMKILDDRHETFMKIAVCFQLESYRLKLWVFLYSQFDEFRQAWVDKLLRIYHQMVWFPFQSCPK